MTALTLRENILWETLTTMHAALGEAEGFISGFEDDETQPEAGRILAAIQEARGTGPRSRADWLAATASATRRVWIIATCAAESTKPCLPEVHTTEEAAEAAMDLHMRAEWEATELEDDAGNRLAYPGDWRKAHAALDDADKSGEWGRWELTVHHLPAA